MIAELKRAKVKLLVDTRAVAASRRPGFSKRQLAASLDEEGIAYLHLQKLGTPAEGREAARAGKLDTLWRIYARHLTTPEAVEAMDELVSIVKSGQAVCLLCYERDKDCCHRTRIAEIALVVDSTVLGSVEGLDRDAGHRREELALTLRRVVLPLGAQCCARVRATILGCCHA